MGVHQTCRDFSGCGGWCACNHRVPPKRTNCVEPDGVDHGKLMFVGPLSARDRHISIFSPFGGEEITHGDNHVSGEKEDVFQFDIPSLKAAHPSDI